MIDIKWFFSYIIQQFGQIYRRRREKSLQNEKHHTDAFRQVITGLHDVITIHLGMKNIDKGKESKT